MKVLMAVALLAVTVAIVSFPLMTVEQAGVIKLELVSWKNSAPEVIVALNLPGKGIMTLVFNTSFGILAACSFLAITHDAYKYRFSWEKRNRRET